jgi:hypothetical protein
MFAANTSVIHRIKCGECKGIRRKVVEMRRAVEGKRPARTRRKRKHPAVRSGVWEKEKDNEKENDCLPILFVGVGVPPSPRLRRTSDDLEQSKAPVA